MSFKLIHRCYPVKKCVQKFRADVEISCSLCLNTDEDSRIMVMLKLLSDFSIQMRNILYLGILTQTPQKKIFVLLYI